MTRQLIAADEALSEPIIANELDTDLSYAVRVPDVITAITGTPTMTFYKQNTGSDLSGTYLTGATSISGTDTIITKTFQNLKAGYWIWNISATVDGKTYVVHRQPFIVKRGSEV